MARYATIKNIYQKRLYEYLRKDSELDEIFFKPLKEHVASQETTNLQICPFIH